MNNYSHYIDGKWIKGEGSKLVSIDPATDKQVWEGRAATNDEINSAVVAAKKAFDIWSNLDLKQRISYLDSFKAIIEQNKDSLATAISQENGKPLWDAKNEVNAMINKIPISIEAYNVRCPEISKTLPTGSLHTRHRPHGCLAVFGPFNFPAHLPNGHIVPALLAGNTIVFKPSELTPGVAALTVQYWENAGLPHGVLNLVQGGRETGKSLLENPALNGVLFTGSWPTGQHIAKQLATTPYKILALELGGNNPLVVGTVSNIPNAVNQIIQSAFLSSGQRCTCARRLILIGQKESAKILEELIKQTLELRIGTYSDSPEPFMGPVISGQAVDHLLQQQDILIKNGGTPLLKMKRVDRGAAFISPGIIEVSKDRQVYDEECFGPLLQVIKVESLEQAIAEANNTQYGLTAGILTDREEEYREFLKRVRAGVINWNVPITGASSAAPFGGLGHSGNNRPSGYYAADYCSYPVASTENPIL